MQADWLLKENYYKLKVVIFKNLYFNENYEVFYTKYSFYLNMYENNPDRHISILIIIFFVHKKGKFTILYR